MTFQEKVDSKKEERSLALIQKVSIENNELDLQELRDFNYKYLFGDETHIGINNLISLYYQELYIGVGRSTSTPSLRLDSKISWTNRFEKAVSLEGDSSISSPASDAIYPDPKYGTAAQGVAQQEINTSSSWLNNNSDNGTLTGGSISTISTIITDIGEAASENGDNRFEDIDELIVIAERDATKGSGLLGKRTENSEVYPMLDGKFHLGRDGIDFPDYYESSEKTALTSNLLNLINIFKSDGSYINVIDTLRSEIVNIQSGTNTLFAESGMNLDSHIVTNIIGDVAFIDTLKSDINNFTGTISDSASDNTLYGYYNYFNSFTPSNDISGQSGYSRSAFNSYIYNLITLVNSIKTIIQTRANSIPNKLGDINNGLKKWRFFWTKENIIKPISPLVSLDGIDKAKSQNLKMIKNADDTLDILFPGEEDKWILTPQIFSAFYNPIRDLVTFLPLINKIDIIWLGQPHASKYKIYRKELTNVTEFYDNWTDDLLVEFNLINPNSRFLYTEYSDESVELNKTYVYRIQTIDDENDPYVVYSSSLQSPVFNVETEHIADSIVDGIITFSDQHDFSEGQFIFIENTGIFQITSITNETIIIDSLITETVNLKVYSAPSTVSI